ncbi:MAG: hypothetical protein JW727_05945 [Candidatus Aenigmarchaeota archaeon]|nr:hypothetical protein [Candidatus Aenigmarchaeota archaeon]
MVKLRDVPGLMADQYRFGGWMDKISDPKSSLSEISKAVKKAEIMISRLDDLELGVGDPQIAERMRTRLKQKVPTITSRYYEELFSTADELKQGVLRLSPDSRVPLSDIARQRAYPLDARRLFGPRYETDYFARGIIEYASKILESAEREGRRQDRLEVDLYIQSMDGHHPIGGQKETGRTLNYLLNALMRGIISAEDAMRYVDKLGLPSQGEVVTAKTSLGELFQGVAESDDPRKPLFESRTGSIKVYKKE